MNYCPECEAAIDDEGFEDIGEIISCPECGVELEVISIDPVELDIAFDDEDDDEYEFDEDEDEDEDEWDDDDSYMDDDDDF